MSTIFWPHKGRLSDAERQEIRDHVFQGAEMLRDLGITEDTWLNTVMQHHERMVVSIRRPDGTAFLDPRNRGCACGEFAVADALSQWDRSGINRYRLWDIRSGT